MPQQKDGRVTYYVVQSFSEFEGEVVLDEPSEAPTEFAARKRAKQLAASKVCVIAFSRSGDPMTGDFDDAVVIYQHGSIPDHLREALAA